MYEQSMQIERLVQVSIEKLCRNCILDSDKHRNSITNINRDKNDTSRSSFEVTILKLVQRESHVSTNKKIVSNNTQKNMIL